MKNIALFGGSFDPPHRGHWQLVHYARKICHLEKIIIMPAYQPYLKKRRLSPWRRRLEMLKLMFAGQSGVSISEWEVSRKRPVSTYFTYRHFQKRFSRKNLLILLGSDSFNQIPHWKNGQKLQRNGKFIIGVRPGYPPKIKNSSAIVLNRKFPDISSSRIRQFIRQRKFLLVKKYLFPAVYEYIRKNRLYQ